MNEITVRTTPTARHLYSGESLARAVAVAHDIDLTRHHGQANGIRVHAIVFAMLSTVALAIAITAAVLATATM